MPDRETVSRPPAAAPRLQVKARALAGGLVEVTAFAPAAGTVKVTARARIKVGRRSRVVVVTTGSARARKRGNVQIRVRPVRRYRGLLKKQKKLAATLLSQYVPAQGARRLSRTTRITFLQSVPKKKPKKHKRKAGRSHAAAIR